MKPQTGPFSFHNYCFGVWLFCLLVILWGAWVRISHSGDACGQNWPSCDGKYILDSFASLSVWIEWIHRATSGLFGLAVIFLTIWAFIKFPSGHSIRKISVLSTALMLIEALIGAGLVLFGLTGHQLSSARILVMGFHLMNSLLLTISLFIVWRFSLGKRWIVPSKRLQKIIFVLISSFIIVIFFGSIASLSVTLYPSSSLLSGILLDFQSHTHWLIRLRMLHPVLALLFGGFILFYYFHFLPPQKKKQLVFKNRYHLFMPGFTIRIK